MKHFAFMAVARGKESRETGERKFFIGTAAVGIEAINPDKKGLESIYSGRVSIDKDPIYVGTTTVKNYKGEDVTVPSVRINFIAKVDKTLKRNNGIDAIIPFSIFLAKEYSYSTKDGVTKVKVIDPYGRTAWVTSEQLKAGAIPEYDIHNGPKAGQKMKARLAPGYRKCYIGEDTLTQIIINYLGLPAPDKYDEDKREYVLKSAEELEDSLCMLDNIDKYFSGNVKELKDIFQFQPNNRMLVNFGVRTAKDGSQYQCAYTQYTGKLGYADYHKSLEKRLKDDAQFGRHPSEEYRVCNIEEYTIKSSSYEESPAASNDPFASAEPQLESVVDDLPLDTDPFAGM